MSNKIKTSGAALAALCASLAMFEGRSLVAYIDPVGIPTICEGWTHGVSMGDVATETECDALTLTGIEHADSILSIHIADFPDAPLMRSAYVSFIYNVGPGAKGVKDGFVWLGSGGHSTMYQLLKKGEYSKACDEFPKWTLAGGKRLRGLINRRAEERRMCHEGLLNYTFNGGNAGVVDKRVEIECPDIRESG